MTYPIKRTVYATEDGTVTLDSGEGKNRPAFVAGTVVSRKQADLLNLPQLDEQADAAEAKANDGLAGLKPAVVATATESGVKPKAAAKSVANQGENNS